MAVIAFTLGLILLLMVAFRDFEWNLLIALAPTAGIMWAVVWLRDSIRDRRRG